jgi:hypothetical protein
MVSNRSSGSRSGSHRPSAAPYSLSVAVPATAKSLGVVMHPMLLQSANVLSSLAFSLSPPPSFSCPLVNYR